MLEIYCSPNNEKNIKNNKIRADRPPSFYLNVYKNFVTEDKFWFGYFISLRGVPYLRVINKENNKKFNIQYFKSWKNYRIFGEDGLKIKDIREKEFKENKEIFLKYLN